MENVFFVYELGNANHAWEENMLITIALAGNPNSGKRIGVKSGFASALRDIVSLASRLFAKFKKRLHKIVFTWQAD